MQALSELSDFERETPLLTDMWTARDILAHLAGWAAWDLSATQGMIKAGHADFSAVIDVDAFNAKSVAERSNQTWEQLVDEMKQAQASWIELLSALNDRDLFISTRFSSPEWETLADWVALSVHLVSRIRIVVQDLWTWRQVLSWPCVAALARAGPRHSSASAGWATLGRVWFKI